MGVFVWAVLKIDQYTKFGDSENKASCMPSSLYTPLLTLIACMPNQRLTAENMTNFCQWPNANKRFFPVLVAQFSVHRMGNFITNIISI